MPDFEHPLQLFRLTYPEGWQAQYREEGQMFLLAAPAGSTAGVLSVAPMAVKSQAAFAPEQVAGELEETARRAGLPAQAGDVRVRESGGKVTAFVEGLSPRQLPGAEGALLRLWMVRQGALPLILTHMGPGTTLAAQREAVDAVVESLAFPEILPPTPGEFAARVMDVLGREYPHLEPEVATEEGNLRLRDRRSGRVADLALENLYRAALLAPESAGALIRDYLDRLTEGLALPEKERSFPEVRDRLLPMLKPQQWVDGAQGEGERTYVTVPFAEGLQVCFVVDEGEMVVFVTQELLAEWGVSGEQVEGLALDNLARRPLEPGLLGIPGEDGQPVALIVGAQDGYAAARILLPDLRQQLADLLGDDFLIGLPNRDFLIGFRESAREAEALIRQIKADFHRMDHPLTDTLYRVRPDRIDPTGI